MDITLNINIEVLCCSRTSPKIHKFCDFNPFNFFFASFGQRCCCYCFSLLYIWNFTSWHCQIYFHFYLSFVRHKRLSERAAGGGGGGEGGKKVCRTEFSVIMNGEKKLSLLRIIIYESFLMYKVLSYFFPPLLPHTTLCVLTLIHSWSNCDKYIFLAFIYTNFIMIRICMHTMAWMVKIYLIFFQYCPFSP